MHIFQVDAFTDRPFTGNPAGVCLLDAPRPDEWLQDVAREMNLPETAFLTPGEGEGRYGLRWFTPTAEVDLCGHATLASAHVLWSEGLLPRERRVAFDTRSGRLSVWPEDGWIAMDFPAEPAVDVPEPDGLRRALDAEPVYVGKNRLDYLVVLADERAVRELAPDVRGLARLDARGVIVTAAAGAGPVDFVSRFFAPAIGIPEDPVTGSAHCCLGPYWAARLAKPTLVGYQASARGGRVRVRPDGDRVVLAGQAVTTADVHLRPEAASPR